ncbi:MAG: hypothetical protein CMB80_05810 [Flammeovirgaceae bacterium]|nr:hypothetical protein [Flammeovirgaceae bacterium]|tara:strand:+ start:3953 stop:4165 length:213 start_codon:yes stop_codon:yes gene_type:complete
MSEKEEALDDFFDLVTNMFSYVGREEEFMAKFTELDEKISGPCPFDLDEEIEIEYSDGTKEVIVPNPKVR